MTTEEVLDEESTCYTTILALLTLAVAAFVYRFLGPDQLKQPAREPVIQEVEIEEQVQSDEPVQEAQASEPVQSKPDEPETQESSDGSDFETINPSDVPELVEDIVPEEVAAVHVEEPIMEKPVVEPIIQEPAVESVVEEPVIEELPVEAAEEVETEEDLVKTIELDHIDVALDDYLGRDQLDQIEPEKSTEKVEPVEVSDTEDTPEPIELIEETVEQVQQAELVSEPIIEPIDVNRVEEIQPVQTDTPVEEKAELVEIIEKVEETAVEEQIISNQFNLADQTIMTPMAPKHQDNGIEDIIEPIKLDLEESKPEPIEDIERKIENVAEQLIADTLGQIKSNVNIIAQDVGDVVVEEKIVNKTAEPDVDEKKVRAEQLSDIADLIAQTPNMAGEGLNLDEQAKLYLE